MEIGATNRIINLAVFDILKMFLMEARHSDDEEWSREQVWYLIKEIAGSKDGSITYHQVLLSDLFKKNGEASIRALQQADLVTVVSANGYPHLIKPSRPVLRTAFQRLAENKVLSSRLDLDIMSVIIRSANENIQKCEQELHTLGTLNRQPRELNPRISWLLQKVYRSQEKIAKCEKDGEALRAILVSER